MPIQDFIIRDADGVPRLYLKGGNQTFSDFTGGVDLGDFMPFEEDFEDLEECVAIAFADLRFNEEDLAQIAGFLGPLDVVDIKFGENCVIETTDFYNFVETFWNEEKSEICISFTDKKRQPFSHLKGIFRFAYEYQPFELDDGYPTLSFYDESRNLSIGDAGLFFEKIYEKISTLDFPITTDAMDLLNDEQLFSDKLLFNLHCKNEEETEVAADTYLQRVLDLRNVDPCRSTKFRKDRDPQDATALVIPITPSIAV